MLLLVPLLMMTSVPGPADLETVSRGSLSGIERPREVVIRTEAGWRALWMEHGPGQDIPMVDFSTRTVIAVFLGSRRTAGYVVEITAVERRAGETIVNVREGRPAPGQMLAQVITTPFHIVSVPRVEGPVTFVRVEPEQHGAGR
jgi:hypothetical protein